MTCVDDRQRAALVAKMGDAAAGACSWLDVTSALERAFEVDMVSLEIADLVTGETRILTGKIDGDAQREYEQHVFHINPRVHIPDPAPLTVYADRHYALHAPTAGEYYDWVERHRLQCRWAAGGAVLMDRNHFGVAALLNSADRGPPSEEKEAVWAEFLNHFHNALRVEQALTTRGSLGDLSDFGGGSARAVLGRDGLIREASPAFIRLLSASGTLAMVRGGLEARRGIDRPRLEHFLALAAAGAATPPVRLARPDGGRGVVLRAIPMDRGRDIFARLAPASMLVLVDLDAPAAARKADLRALWGLTDREADLALILASGVTLENAAARLKMREGTARHHLKTIFRRMEIDRQAELVRLVTLVG